MGLNPGGDHPTSGPAISGAHPLTMRPLESADDLKGLWNQADLLSYPGAKGAPFVGGFACSDRCVEEVQRLRYEVFNLELGEGLVRSTLTGLDTDEYDAQMTHLVLLDPATGHVVGTYRIQTASEALRHRGLYSASLFDLSALEPYFRRTIELGRACLAKDYRTLHAILTLWTGLGVFMNLFDQQYLFGCCSLTTQDPDDGWRAMKTIRAKGFIHKDLHLVPRPERTCGDPAREFEPDLGDAIPLPKLFKTYMRLGARVMSQPAIDREFGTVDFLVILDGKQVALSQLDILK